MADQKEEQVVRAEKATKKILKQSSADLPVNEQMKLGKPLKDETGVNPEDMKFLQILVDKIEKKEVNLFVPSSLLNTSVYEKLDEQVQGKADFNAMNLLSTIRNIYKLWELGERDSYEIQNLVHQVRMTKERLEDIGGDIYVI